MAVDHPCPLCGHSLVGQQVGGRCPECSLLIVPGAGVMRPRELFILGVRLIGAWQAFAVVDMGLALVKLLRTPVPERMGLGVIDYAIPGAVYAVLCVYCLLGAPHLVGLTYGHTIGRQTSAGETEAPQE